MTKEEIREFDRRFPMIAVDSARVREEEAMVEAEINEDWAEYDDAEAEKVEKDLDAWKDGEV